VRKILYDFITLKELSSSD